MRTTPPNLARRQRVAGIAMLGAAMASSSAASASSAGPGAATDFGHEFVTVGAPGNAPYAGPPTYGSLPVGRGRVDYAYRIGRTEVATIQWMDFLNTFTQTATPPRLFDIYAHSQWGAQQDFEYTGPGIRYRLRDVPHAARLPVTGISFNMAVLYCNWLHNGGGPDPAGLVTGAYDTTVIPSGPRPNQHLYPTHLPGARYWVPTLDEWLKAAHYDPDRLGPGQGGWWTYRNSADTPGVPGPPGQGTTSAGWDPQTGNFPEWLIPLEAYQQSRSPWGLLDTSGGAAEWTEEIGNPSLPSPQERILFWPTAGRWSGPLEFSEWIGSGISSDATNRGLNGLRLASAVPSPSFSIWAVAGAWLACGRRRARGCRPRHPR